VQHGAELSRHVGRIERGEPHGGIARPASGAKRREERAEETIVRRLRLPAPGAERAEPERELRRERIRRCGARRDRPW
jgi:hypothetical protein